MLTDLLGHGIEYLYPILLKTYIFLLIRDFRPLPHLSQKSVLGYTEFTKTTAEAARVREIDQEQSSCFVEGRRFAKLVTHSMCFLAEAKKPHLELVDMRTLSHLIRCVINEGTQHVSDAVDYRALLHHSHFFFTNRDP